jgi:hypothetical protein
LAHKALVSVNLKNIASLHLYNVEQGLLSVNYLIYQVQGLSAHQVFYQFAPKAHATLGRGNENYTSAIC